MIRIVFLSLLCISARAAAQTTPDSTAGRHADAPSGSAGWGVQLLGTQVNAIWQRMGAFTSPYSGSNSLIATGDHAVSHVYGVYVGAAPFTWGAAGARQTRIEAYVDVEMARGHGLSRATGLAGVTNGDVLRAGTADLGNGPYVARAFLRYVRPLGADRATDTLSRAPDQIARVTTSHRLEVTAGKLAASDLFDLNRYANTTRTQYLNWSLFQNTAWDFAADTRGYTNGVAAAWITPRWSLRVGSFQMPREANGNRFDANLQNARGDNVELTLTPPIARAPTIRLLGFQNRARMGRYADANALAAETGGVPNIVTNDRPGRRKRGWGINIEQPLADDGETGAFLRIAANDGENESFAFTEVDRHLSAGLQVAGTRWHRREDRFAIAAVQHGIVDAHQAYLAAGGVGFLLGDGRLNYAPERILESYYRIQVGRYLQASPDLQLIWNPGYNHDRGPVNVVSLRVNLRY